MHEYNGKTGFLVQVNYLVCQKPSCFSPAATLSGSSWPSTL